MKNTSPFLSGAGAGYFSGGVVAIAGIQGGAVAFVQVVAWDTTLGGTTTNATFAQAQSWGFPLWGASSAFSVVTGAPELSPPGLPAALVGLTSFTLGYWLSPYFSGFTIQPTNQAVIAGSNATFCVHANAFPPPSYQWYFNGTTVAGSTASTYQISDVQITNAGPYWAVLSNPDWGSHTSATATLTVQGFLAFTSQPQSQTVVVGSNAGFGVNVIGGAPYAFQWLLNGSPVPGATQSTLLLVDVQPAQAGTYTVVVTNAAGAVTSTPAMLNVIPPVEQRSVPGLVLRGQSGMLLNIETNDVVAPLANWATFDKLVLSNASQWYFDLSSPLSTQRFYRAWQTGAPADTPSIDAHMVPAITLTGSIGDSLRLDYINRFGPTDAWVALDTVTLTNTSQLYFDTSAIGQPPRLWRVVPVP